MNRFVTFPIVCPLFSLLALTLCGCGGDQRPPGFPKLYPVSIKVIQEGSPLADASVSLRISDASMTWSIGGRTDERGIAILSTHGRFRGAPEGKFKVTVEKIINEGEAEMLAAMSGVDAADERAYAAARRGHQVNSFSYVNEEYNSFNTTPIEIEINRKSREIEIDAGPAVKIRREYMM
jgi:hypothetical protein